MAQTSVIVTLTQGSAVVTCDPSNDLSALVVPARLLLTGIDQSLPAAKTTLRIQSFAKVGNAWTLNLAANFGNASLAAVAAQIHTSFTPHGYNQWDTGDTATKPQLNDDNDTSEQLMQLLYARLGDFSPLDHGAVGDGVTDDTAAVQAAVTAACAQAPARVLLTRRFRISSTITGNTGICIQGVSPDAGIVDAQITGDTFYFAPSGPVETNDMSQALKAPTFRSFSIDPAPGVTKTSGYAIHIEYANNPLVEQLTVDSNPDFLTPHSGVMPPMFGGVFFDKCANARLLMPQFYISGVGACFTGSNLGGTAAYSFGGVIGGGGGGYIYGNYASNSVGVWIAGRCGGVTLQHCDIGQHGRFACLVDMSLTNGTNHEVFVGEFVFFDSAGVCAWFVASNALNILRWPAGWGAGSGRKDGLSVGGPTDPVYNGAGLYIQGPQATLVANISGAHCYANNGTGIIVEDCYSFAAIGVDCYANGASLPPTGGHGMEFKGGNNINVQASNLIANHGCGFAIRSAVSSYFVTGNFTAGSQANIEENNGSRTPNMYAGFNVDGVGDVSRGPQSISAAPSEVDLPSASSPFALSAANGTWVNVTGLSLTIAAAGRYRVYASLRYSAQISSGDGFLAGQLTVNGSAIGGSTWVSLIDDLQAPNVPVQRTSAALEWTSTFAKGDVLQIELKRDGNAVWTTSNIVSDSNGVTKFGFFQIP